MNAIHSSSIRTYFLMSSRAWKRLMAFSVVLVLCLSIHINVVQSAEQTQDMFTASKVSKLFANKNNGSFVKLISEKCCKNSTMCNISETIVAEQTKKLAPPLSNDRHKGQSGRIGVFGGSIEYTGAPYFASISSLKVGADLVYVFCNKDAATVIKSYSPELIVLPVLDDPEAMAKIEPWLERLHVILIGPGLGRHQETFNVIGKVIEACRKQSKPLVIDADGLFFVSQNPDVIKNYPAPVILTPNVMEFNRLVGQNNGDGTKLERSSTFINSIGSNITILCKDNTDEIISGGKVVTVTGGGSGRRCGGQGDLLAGSLSTFLAWALMNQIDVNVACYAASRLTRECNSRAFEKFGRSMTTSDMLHEIGGVFRDKFELK